MITSDLKRKIDALHSSSDESDDDSLDSTTHSRQKRRERRPRKKRSECVENFSSETLGFRIIPKWLKISNENNRLGTIEIRGYELCASVLTLRSAASIDVWNDDRHDANLVRIVLKYVNGEVVSISKEQDLVRLLCLSRVLQVASLEKYLKNVLQEMDKRAFDSMMQMMELTEDAETLYNEYTTAKTTPQPLSHASRNAFAGREDVEFTCGDRPMASSVVKK
jgi:hypothetical protein